MGTQLESDIGIIGAGAAGLLLSRVFAEDGLSVRLYEREAQVGGNLTRLEGPLKLHLEGPDIYNWFARRTHIVRSSFLPQLFVPQESLAQFCTELIDHPHIHVTLNAPVVHFMQFFTCHEVLFFTGDLDRLFDYRYGHLPYDQHAMPLRSPETYAIWQRYYALSQHYGLLLFGTRPFHDVSWVHQLWQSAMRVAGAS